MSRALRQLSNPGAEQIPAGFEAFLRWLGQPTWIRIGGADGSRHRCIVTLLHGNETSGARAMQRYLRSGEQPATNVSFFVVSVATALAAPLFSHRQLPGARDMNRCFKAPFDQDAPGRLANVMLDTLDSLAPEVVVDIHNTSGEGPAFAVSPALASSQLALAAYFTRRLVVTDLRLGALMETYSAQRPVITIECGGAGATADDLAYSGLCRLLSTETLFDGRRPPADMDIYHHPVRLELADGHGIAYGNAPAPLFAEGADVVLPPDIDRRNFGVVTPDIPLGWVKSPEVLRLNRGDRLSAIDDFFAVRGNCLYAAHPLKLFMVTTNPRIARSDCLLYAVREMDHQHLQALLAQS